MQRTSGTWQSSCSSRTARGPQARATAATAIATVIMAGSGIGSGSGLGRARGASASGSGRPPDVRSPRSIKCDFCSYSVPKEESGAYSTVQEHKRNCPQRPRQFLQPPAQHKPKCENQAGVPYSNLPCRNGQACSYRGCRFKH